MFKYGPLPLLVVTLLLGPLASAAPAAQLWPIWNAAQESNPARIDHAQWQRLLDLYVAADSGGINRVAYARVSAGDRERLRAYLQMLSQFDPRDYAQAEQLAYWVNLYNALTVEVVLSHPDKGSILRMGKGLFSIGPWNDEVIRIAGVAVTLNDIEHRILRPIWKDRRIHYALNCASLSCPNLDKQAYTRDNSERLLTVNETAYINHSRGVRFDEGGRLVVSQIYEWYSADFSADRQGLLDYLAQHQAALAVRLRTYPGRIRYAYDWALNGSAAQNE